MDGATLARALAAWDDRAPVIPMSADDGENPRLPEVPFLPKPAPLGAAAGPPAGD